MKNIKNWAHQGDVVFEPVTKLPEGALEKHNGSVVVAWGEATGHNHTVVVDRPQEMEVVKIGGDFFIRLKTEGVVKHQEHKPIKLAPGIYKIGHEREVDHFADGVVRKVVD